MYEERPSSYLAVVGPSAGGIGALSELVSSLPEDFLAPIVNVQHLNPSRESIPKRRNTLPFRTLNERTALQLKPGVVFVTLADRNVNTTDHDIYLHKASVGLRSVHMGRSGWEAR